MLHIGHFRIFYSDVMDYFRTQVQMCSLHCKSYKGIHLHPCFPRILQTSLPLHEQTTTHFTKLTIRTFIMLCITNIPHTKPQNPYIYYQLVARCSSQKWRWPSRDSAWFSSAPHTQTAQQSNQQEQDTYSHPKNNNTVNKEEIKEPNYISSWTLRWLSMFSTFLCFHLVNT